MIFVTKHLEQTLQLKNMCHQFMKERRMWYLSKKNRPNNGLTYHIDNVNGDKLPYECKACDSKFVDRISLVQHISSVHEGNKSFNCESCKKRFAWHQLNSFIF